MENIRKWTMAHKEIEQRGLRGLLDVRVYMRTGKHIPEYALGPGLMKIAQERALDAALAGVPPRRYSDETYQKAFRTAFGAALQAEIDQQAEDMLAIIKLNSGWQEPLVITERRPRPTRR